MNKIKYDTYFDKIYGCFLGKTVIGTLGAPFEGIKMPFDIPFKAEMIDTSLPNDDLDLQILWLDVLKQHGENFTSLDLLRSFCENCDYSPGEYAVMRKNYERGIYPPISGKFCNDFYINGMGCPIRSEIWACISPLDPTHAADLSERDGVLDHAGDSVYSERFFAALESAAFFENDLYKLIEIALKEVPESCKFRDLVNDTVSLCKKNNDIKTVLRKILFKYGHPDCTNLYENIGITLAALLLGDMDIIKTGMMALGCGFDTDCTCATAGAVIGLIKGADSLLKDYDFGDVKFVAGVRCEERSDKVIDLAKEIALLGSELNKGNIENAPETHFEFKPSQYPLEITAHYQDDMPVMYPGRSCCVTLAIKNVSDETVVSAFTLKGIGVNERFSLAVAPGDTAAYEFDASVDEDKVIFDSNIYTLYYSYENKTFAYDFGVAGATPWKVIGPIWRTDPICTSELLIENNLVYRDIIRAVEYDGNRKDVSRRFHLNFAIDTETDYVDYNECFAPLGTSEYEETVFYQTEDSFTMDDLFGFKGPCVAYLSKILVAPKDMEVCVQIGHSSPFSLFINGNEIARRDNCDCWTAENVHIENIKLHKGENEVLMRITRANSDAKYNVTFSDGPSCATHFVCFGAVDPKYF